jgi:hypothetical protein
MAEVVDFIVIGETGGIETKIRVVEYEKAGFERMSDWKIKSECIQRM